MSDHMTDAEYEASAILRQSAHESEAFEQSDAAKVAAVAALAESWDQMSRLDAFTDGFRFHLRERARDIRKALADPDAALECVRAEARAEALRDAAIKVQAACPVHITRDYTPVDAAYDNAARVLRELADEAVKS